MDFAAMLYLHYPSRYVMRVSGDALRGRGILFSDTLIADAPCRPSPAREISSFETEERRNDIGLRINITKLVQEHHTARAGADGGCILAA